jgi:hypothetical protein
MGTWTNKDRRTILDDAEDFGYESTGGRVKQWVAGFCLPFWPILFGVGSLRLGRATFFGRDGSVDITGNPAIALNAAYIAFGMFLHFHYFWGLDSNLYRFNRAGKLLSLLALIPCLLYSIGSVLYRFVDFAK